jgi:hypothetical protein
MMRTLKFGLFVAIVALVNSQCDEKVEFAVVEAIKGVLEEFFAPYEPKADLYYNGRKSEALAEKLLLEKPFEVSFRVIRLDNTGKARLDFPSILLFDSIERYAMISSKIGQTNKNRAWPNHLVYLSQDENVDLEELLSENTDYEAAFKNGVYINVVNCTTIDLVTALKLQTKSVFDHFKAINRFTTDTMKWQNKTFFT